MVKPFYNHTFDRLCGKRHVFFRFIHAGELILYSLDGEGLIYTTINTTNITIDTTCAQTLRL